MSTVRRFAAAALATCLAVGVPGAVQARNPWTPAGELRIGFLIEPETLNPLVGGTVAAGDMAEFVFQGLLAVNETGALIPEIATAVPSARNGGISRDGKTITYHLRRDARWQDGVPLRADDVVYTYRQILNPANNVPNRLQYEQIADVTAVDPYTVRVVYKTVYAPALYNFITGATGSILPKHLLEQLHDLNHAPFNTAPVGSGPYRVVAWHHGSDIVLEANPNYAGGAPKIAKITIKILPDSNVRLNALQSHDIDFIGDLDPNEAAKARAMPGSAVVVSTFNTYRHVSFNTRHAPLDDRNVRLALCYATDVQTIFTKLFFSIGALAPADQNPLTQWANPAAKYYPFDPKRAGQILDAAGWVPGPDGIRHKGDKRLSFSITSVAGAKSNESVEVLLQSMWHAVGADVSIKNYPGPLLFNRAADGGILERGEYDTALYSWARNPDPNDQNLIGPDGLPPNGRNYTYYADPEVGRLQEAALRTFDVAARRSDYFKIQAILVRDVPIYTLLWVPFVEAYDDDLHGVIPLHGGTSVFWNVAQWSW